MARMRGDLGHAGHGWLAEGCRCCRGSVRQQGAPATQPSRAATLNLFTYAYLLAPAAPMAASACGNALT